MTAKFDGKENVSRSYNNWITVNDSKLHVYAPLSEELNTVLKNQSIEVTIRISPDDMETVLYGVLQKKTRISRGDKVLKKDFDVHTSLLNMTNSWSVQVCFQEHF